MWLELSIKNPCTNFYEEHILIVLKELKGVVAF